MPNDTRIAPALLPPSCAIVCRKSGSVRSGLRASAAATSSSVIPSAVSPGPGLQKHPVRNEIPCCAGQLLDAAVVEEMSLRIVEVHRHDPAAHRRRQRTVDADHRTSVRMPHRDQPFEQPAGEAVHARLNRVDAGSGQMPQPDLDGGDREVVQRAVFEASLAGREDMTTALDRREVDRAAGKPRSMKSAGERRLRTSRQPTPVG